MVSVDIEKIAVLCVRECVRQDVGLDRVASLLDAYSRAVAQSRQGKSYPSLAGLLALAADIEPDCRGRLRRTPVTFAHGGSANAPETIPAAMATLWEHIGRVAPEDFAYRFLQVHPLSDGNGRTAFLLFNWISGSLEDPSPLPEFSFS